MTPKKTPVSKLSFDQAIGEVEGIVARLENEQTDVDELAGEVKRAVELIATCRERLQGTDREVRELVERLQEEAAARPAADQAAPGTPPPAADGPGTDHPAGGASGAADSTSDEDLPF